MRKRKKRQQQAARELMSLKRAGSTDAARWFKSAPILGAISTKKSTVEAEDGILRNVAVITLGEAKGHGVQIDRVFLAKTVEFGNAAPMGIKSRFGHPNASSTALGTFLGRAKAFRIDPETPDIVRADIHLDESARITPNGDLYAYVLNMAEHNPDMLGTSIVFKPGGETDPRTIDPDGILFEDLPVATILDLMAVDIVDDPAANDGGLFSAWSSDQAAGQITQFLDSNPELWEILDQHPEIIAPFIERYRTYQTSKQEGNDMKTKEQLEAEAAAALEAETAAAAAAAAEAEAAAALEAEAAATALAEEEAAAAALEAEAAAAAAKEAGSARVEELSRIGTDYSAEILAQAVSESLSYDQATAAAFKALTEENEALRADGGNSDGESGALSGGNGEPSKELDKFATTLSDPVAAQARRYEKQLNGE